METNTKIDLQTDRETKAQKFKRVAQPRFIKAVKAIQVLGNCASSDYEYTQEQIEKIEKTLHAEVDEIMARFYGGKEELDIPKL